MCLEEKNRQWDRMRGWGGGGGEGMRWKEGRDEWGVQFIYLFIHPPATGHEGDWDYIICYSAVGQSRRGRNEASHKTEKISIYYVHTGVFLHYSLIYVENAEFAMK